MLNVYDGAHAVGTFAVCPFSVAMDIPTVEVPNGWYIDGKPICWLCFTITTTIIITIITISKPLLSEFYIYLAGSNQGNS
jgi:hypothetical protein